MEKNDFYDAMFKGAEEIGVQKNPDYNGAQQEGVGMTQATIWKGKRQSTAICYLNPVKSRQNLTVLTEAFAEELIIQNNKCIGVRLKHKGTTTIVGCNCEVLVSAGAINTPQLLELSGIGQEDVLKKAGVNVRLALPGVGENLRDHYAPRMKWSTLKGRYTYNDRARGLSIALEVAKYLANKKGFLALPAAPMRAYVKSREGLASPDLGISVNPFLIKSGVSLDKKSGFTMAVHSLRPESRGSVHIVSPSSVAPPKIQYNFLSNRIDQDTLLAGMRIVRQWD
jgi:Choline dehydrogenase and related flavoproteins